jgi:hypothetical protein
MTGSNICSMSCGIAAAARTWRPGSVIIAGG